MHLPSGPGYLMAGKVVDKCCEALRLLACANYLVENAPPGPKLYIRGPQVPPTRFRLYETCKQFRQDAETPRSFQKYARERVIGRHISRGGN